MGVITREEEGRGGEAQGIRSTHGRYKTDGEVKDGMGTGETRELTYMTPGHELRGVHDGDKEGQKLGQL